MGYGKMHKDLYQMIEVHRSVNISCDAYHLGQSWAERDV